MLANMCSIFRATDTKTRTGPGFTEKTTQFISD